MIFLWSVRQSQSLFPRISVMLSMAMAMRRLFHVLWSCCFVCWFSLFSIWIYCLFVRCRCVTLSAVPAAITYTFRYWFFHAAIFITHTHLFCDDDNFTVGSVSNPLSNWRKPSGFYFQTERDRENVIIYGFSLYRLWLCALTCATCFLFHCCCCRFKFTLHCYFGGIY